ncbi:CDP-alcohol phosphatidyltransferase family protein [Methylovirgula sp. 4M-Z18]|uniref:CDP-alcohol phosphatidyltransferase family protein n=1 Tax=Methylovirgula sp. 4M-Z18 TaxID=2293567 RepID=UPI000E2ED6A7|nr:CDP-alcohol phosphatidyltransferase family protein [Methylovirgula sp. 4M-Z18]RFB81213.1 CDP-alcohol phosphatidyltransferase family protein [Methylovirgula sp. 4M-Z18]
MTLYDLKPRFQNLLRPYAQRLAEQGYTANQVTLTAALLSILLGAFLCTFAAWHILFLLLPIWLFLRMALNAIDGMLAREHGQKSTLGGYLNELCDIVSDAALVLPFALLAPFSPFWIFGVIFAAVCSEYAGVMGPLIGASRRYDGPLGKSDRALVFGALGLWTGLGLPLFGRLFWLQPVLIVLSIWTAANRVRRGVREHTSSTG